MPRGLHIAGNCGGSARSSVKRLFKRWRCSRPALDATNRDTGAALRKAGSTVRRRPGWIPLRVAQGSRAVLEGRGRSGEISRAS